MANEQNLRGHEFTSEQSREQAARNGSKGGIASGRARRERKRMREALEELLAKDYTDKDTGRTLDGVSMLMVTTVAKAQKGDMRAMEFIRATLGEDPVRQVDVNATASTEAKFTELLEKFSGEA